jgi:hypothetical protein
VLASSGLRGRDRIDLVASVGVDPIGEAEQIRDRVLLLRSTGENDTVAVLRELTDLIDKLAVAVKDLALQVDTIERSDPAR